MSGRWLRGGTRDVTLQDLPQKKTTSENISQMFPGHLVADPGLTQPVELQPSRRETLLAPPIAPNTKPIEPPIHTQEHI